MDVEPNPTVSTNWRASLVPAAAVIPAPIVYTNIVAVKKLVVDPRVGETAGGAVGEADCADPRSPGRLSHLPTRN